MNVKWQSIHLCLKLDAGLTPRVLPSDETWIHIFCNLIFDANRAMLLIIPVEMMVPV